MLTRVVALEERHHGLAAYALAPGLVDTDMQALIRSTSAEAFPMAARFRQVFEADGFNSAEWVARFILDRFVDGADPAGSGSDASPGTLRIRVPDQKGPKPTPR
jgi:NAD(P)-dependent dehydrogenase (short-subunit alcohol dehydrogenase family)